jgi:hypothetical protein
VQHGREDLLLEAQLFEHYGTDPEIVEEPLRRNASLSVIAEATKPPKFTC